MQNFRNKYQIILLFSAIILFDIFLILTFVGDILILNGLVESTFFEQFGILPMIYSLVIEISLFIFSIILLTICYRKYKYDKK